ncbi:hypothetical protein P7K49_032943 [Saguinus oedipus]|uniref:Uncharacterized protein n=1 Tax=Saguinus oedipus TaxID=9490 RepID=A0ABQ9TQX6_SAGOE|nr:hypothetical protein P7K49_032943 [Saguinus oedipus]
MRREQGRPPTQAQAIGPMGRDTRSRSRSAAEPEREPKSEQEPWAPKPAAPGGRGTAQTEAAEPGAQVGSLREQRWGFGSYFTEELEIPRIGDPGELRDPRRTRGGFPGEGNS